MLSGNVNNYLTVVAIDERISMTLKLVHFYKFMIYILKFSQCVV